MNMFTSEDPPGSQQEIQMEIMIQEPVNQEEKESTLQVEENSEVLMIPENLFSDSVEMESDSSNIEKIRILLESYLDNESETTTDYYSIIMNNVSDIKESVNVMGHDQQTIGLLSVGSSIVILGILVVYVFLGRIR